MIFSSNIFLFLFLPLCLTVYFIIQKIFRQNTTILNLVLLLFSLFFYLWGSGRFLLVFITSIIINFILSKFICRFSNKKIFLALGIIFNLALLFYFKYFNFFYQQINLLFHSQLPPQNSIFLPIGISFYTFMAITYLVDVYQHQRPASLLNFSTYLSLFPHLVAGPIVRYHQIATEMNKRFVDKDMFFNGVWRFSTGLGKKVIIANNLGVVADKIFSLPQNEFCTLLAWIGIISYTFQIFFDFSGYSDMAIGLAKMFGFNFPENFNQPYTATSVTDFWHRWHISLSTFFKDFLYIPLGGNRKGSLRTYLNLLIVFLLCGLWHGASWTFIVWGLYHGSLQILERLTKNKICCHSLTFLLITIGWVFFRSPTLSFSFNYLKTMFSYTPYHQQYYTIRYYLPPNIIFYFILASLLSFSFFPKINNKTIKGCIAIAALLWSIAFLSKSTFTPFIYFQF